MENLEFNISQQSFVHDSLPSGQPGLSQYDTGNSCLDHLKIKNIP